MPRASAWVGLALFAMLVQGATVGAARAAGWIASDVSGTVVKLVRGEWQECERGAKVSGEVTLRTLRGRLVLEHETGKIRLGGGTAIQLGGRSGGTTVMQYSGTVAIEAGGAPIAIETPVLAVVAGDGVATVAFDGATARVQVESGTVTVLDRVHGGRAVLLAAGQTATGTAAGMGISGRARLPPVDARGRVGSPAAGALPARGVAPGRAADPGKGKAGEHDDNGSNGNNEGEGGKGRDRAID